MERAAVLERLGVRRAPLVWRVATVAEVREENSRARTVVLDVPEWPDHLAGQQVTADGSLSFSFGSVSFANPQHAGPLVVFLELCSESKSMDTPGPIIESNTLTALIFVQADKKGEH